MEDNKLIYYRTDVDFDWQQLDDLRSYRIGIVDGFSYSDAFDLFLQTDGVTVQKVQDNESGFLMLSSGRIDIFVCTQSVAESILTSGKKGAFAQSIAAHPKILHADAFYLLVNKDVPNAQQIITAFNLGLQQLRDSGQYQQLMQR